MHLFAFIWIYDTKKNLFGISIPREKCSVTIYNKNCVTFIEIKILIKIKKKKKIRKYCSFITIVRKMYYTEKTKKFFCACIFYMHT